MIRSALTDFENAPFEIIDGDRGKNYPKQNEFSDSGSSADPFLKVYGYLEDDHNASIFQNIFVLRCDHYGYEGL